MLTNSPPAAPRRRRRHDRLETEREILQAGEQLLREASLRDITVEQIMLRTGLKRPAFYAHFRDREDLVLRVVQHIADELFEMASRWLVGEAPERDIRAALEGIASVYVTHGPVLRAVADAAPADARVEKAYRAFVQSFIDATAERIRSEQAAGSISETTDAPETARALIWLNERYLTEAFGHHPQDEPSRVIAVLHHIWLATLYGADGSGAPSSLNSGGS
jgi:TetR/AcrR family transcriptional regulator, ethionamide resistance regulator